MIKVKRIGLVNWHTINTWQVLPFDPHVTFITGDNAAGKTAIADAIQSVLLATLDNYNLSNDVEGRKYRRTFMGYTRGKLLSGKYLRNGLVYTHIVAELEKDGELILFGLSSVVNANIYDKFDKKWWKAKGTLDDVTPYTQQGDRKVISSLEQFTNGLQIKKYDNSAQAKRELSRLLGYSKSAVGDENAFKQIIKIYKQAVAFDAKEAGNVDKYLRTNIFNETEIDIKDYQYTLENQNKLQDELQDIKNEADTLKSIEQTNHEFLQAEKHAFICDTAAKILERDAAAEKVKKGTLLLKELYEEKNSIELKKTRLEEESENVIVEKDRLTRESGISDITREIERQRQRVLEVSKAKTEVENYSRLMEEAKKHGVTEPLFESVTDISRKRYECRDELENLVVKRKVLEEEQRSLERKSGYADKRYMPAMNELSDYFRMEKRVAPEFLYKCLECEEEWQEAVEAFLGNQRYDIVVSPEDYRIAAEFIHDNFKGQVTLINLEGIQKREPVEGTLASVVTSSNQLLRDYICEKYNRVFLSQNVATEKYMDGTYIDKALYRYSGRRFSSMQKVHLIIGEKARLKRLEEVGEELENISERKAELEKSLQNFLKAEKAGKELLDKKVSEEKTVLASTYPMEIGKLENLEKSREVMMSDDYKGKMVFYEQRLKEIRKEQKHLDEEKEKLFKRIAGTEDVVLNANNILDSIHLEDTDTEEAKIYIATGKTIQKIKAEKDAFENEKLLAQNDLKRKCEKYNADYGVQFRVAECLARLSELDNEKIPGLISDLEESKRETKTKLIEHVIAGHQEYIRKANHFISSVNRTLETLPFNGTTYSLKPVAPADGKEEWFWAIKNYVAENDTFSMFEKPDTDANTRLVKYLYDNLCLQIEKKSSENFLDYATFCKFGLYAKKDDEEKRDMQEVLGERSGAEVQVPVYMILAIALVNKTGHSKFSIKETDALRLMCVDEAFEKMDAENKRKMLELLNEKLGVQLVTIAPLNSLEDFLVAGTYIFIQNQGTNRFTYAYTKETLPDALQEYSTNVVA